LAKEVIMPKFGFTQEESEILEWLVNDGEKVDKGDPIAVVSTDKISMEVEAPESGTLSGIKYGVGSVVPVTKIIAYILEPGEKVPVGEEGESKADASEKVEKKEDAEKTSAKPAAAKAVKISPVAARMIEEKSLDASTIPGSGPGGQITREDVEQYIKSSEKTTGKVNATPAARRVAGEKSLDLRGMMGSGPAGRIQEADVRSGTPVKETKIPIAPTGAIHKEIPLIGMRRTIAENMQRSMQEAPHMTLQVDVQMDAVEAQRNDANSRISDKSKKISATAVLVKACALAIRKNMIINSQFTPEKILVKENINVGVAVAIEDGLIVPVVANADIKQIQTISAEVNDLAQRSRFARLKPQDLMDGTFTISNLGMLGIDRFTAIINPPQSAILAVGAIRRQVVPDDADVPVIRIAKILTLTLSADHRVMDGAQAAYFLADLKNLLEIPGELFL
jgi:pyruvate dehydrogenase E2 component (dihydrolipoamide acetyltransferase)